MTAAPKTRIQKAKICCIGDVAEAEMAIEAGAWALGLVAEMPSGIGPISDEQIASIHRAVKGRAETFLLTSRTRAEPIIEHHQTCQTTTLQLVDEVAPEDLVAIRQSLPGVRLVQVIHVQGPESVSRARAVAGLVDMILLDSGNPGLAVKELGGTGRTHDWSLSADIVEQVQVPVMLAGGLNPGNVREAVQQVRPWGVDLCSGIRDGGALQQDQLQAFMKSLDGAHQQ